MKNKLETLKKMLEFSETSKNIEQKRVGKGIEILNQ